MAAGRPFFVSSADGRSNCGIDVGTKCNASKAVVSTDKLQGYILERERDDLVLKDRRVLLLSHAHSTNGVIASSSRSSDGVNERSSEARDVGFHMAFPPNNLQRFRIKSPVNLVGIEIHCAHCLCTSSLSGQRCP